MTNLNGPRFHPQPRGHCTLPMVGLIILLAQTVWAQSGPPHIPPPGIAVPETDRQELTAGVNALGQDILDLRKKLSSDPRHLSLLPDVEIFHKAVDWALRYDEFFDAKQIAFA